MTIEIFTALMAFSFVSSITPGPNNLMLLASGTNFGFRRTMPHLFGVAIGFTVMVILVGVGLIQLFDRFPLSYQVLKIVSIVYLIYLAWKIATAAAPTLGHDGNQLTSTAKPFSFIQAALFQWVNPKGWAMALTAIAAYTPASHPFSSVLIVALMFGVVNLPSIAVWVWLGSQIKRYLSNEKLLRIFNITAAILLLLSLYPILVS